MPSTVEFFKTELRRLPFAAGLRFNGDYAWIRCPYHANGRERSGSCRIRLTNGRYPAGGYKCFGCDAHGEWNELAKTLGLTELNGFSREKHVSGLDERNRAKMFGTVTTSEVNHVVGGPWQATENWRGIRGSLIKRMGGQLVTRMAEQHTETVLYLPIQMWGEPAGGIYCQIKPAADSRFKYVYTEDIQWKTSLFPYDWVAKHYRRSEPLWLVEGARDALNPIQHGAWALSNLGAKTTWSEDKCAAIVGLDPSLLIIAFDGDEPGQAAARLSARYFRNRLNFRILRFPPPKIVGGKKVKRDPGNLRRREIKQIIQYYQQVG